MHRPKRALRLLSSSSCTLHHHHHSNNHPTATTTVGMIRTVTGALDAAKGDAATAAQLTLMGAHELLVTSPEANATTTTTGPGGEPPRDDREVTLDALAGIRACPESFLWNVLLPSIEEIQRELEAGVDSSSSSSSSSSSLGLVLHAPPGAMLQDRTPLRRLADKLDRRVLVVTGALPVLPTSPSTAAAVAANEPKAIERAAGMLVHRLRFGVPLVAPSKPTAAAAGKEAEEEEEEEQEEDEALAALHDPTQRVGVGFIGMLELLRDNERLQRQGPLLAAAAAASVETGAPIFLTTSDAFGRAGPDVEKINEAIGTLVGLNVPAASIVLCRLPGDAALEPTYLAWLRRGVTLAFTFQAGVFYSLVVTGKDKDKGTTRDFPSDGEVADVIASLCRQGFGAQLLMSPGVCSRIQLKRYGGHGYGHVRQNVVSHLVQRGVAQEDLNRMANSNIVRLLGWWTPPPPVERPVEMGKCDWCGKAFELRENEYFSKFAFTYCRGKCLSAHGNTGWKPLAPK
jgi:predicted metal-dependent phosphotriesterase family hydrolase